MEESTVYQDILAKGVLQGKQEFLLEFGSDRFGPAPAEIQSLLRSVRELDRLQRICGRLAQAKNWQDLLATP